MGKTRREKIQVHISGDDFNSINEMATKADTSISAVARNIIHESLAFEHVPDRDPLPYLSHIMFQFHNCERRNPLDMLRPAEDFFDWWFDTKSQDPFWPLLAKNQAMEALSLILAVNDALCPAGKYVTPEFSGTQHISSAFVAIRKYHDATLRGETTATPSESEWVAVLSDYVTVGHTCWSIPSMVKRVNRMVDESLRIRGHTDDEAVRVFYDWLLSHLGAGV